MSKRKPVRTRGKVSLKRYFQELKEGEFVTVVRDQSLVVGFPKKLQGRTGVVQDKRGSAYIVKIKDLEKEKTYIINTVHLRRIKTLKNDNQ